MIGAFSYRRKDGAWTIHYQGLFDEHPRLLGPLAKTPEGCWTASGPTGLLGPFEERWQAGVAYLEALYDPASQQVEAAIAAVAARHPHVRRADRRLASSTKLAEGQS
jgi:hypothetical protein